MRHNIWYKKTFLLSITVLNYRLYSKMTLLIELLSQFKVGNIRYAEPVDLAQ